MAETDGLNTHLCEPKEFSSMDINGYYIRVAEAVEAIDEVVQTFQ